MSGQREADWRFIHGAMFALLLACTLAVPEFRRWPWLWLVPLVVYFVIVVLFPPLRHSLTWIRVGRVSTTTIAATLAAILLTAITLLSFQAATQSDVSRLREALPLNALGGLVLAGVVFSIVNATLEELIFRGLLFDAVESQWGTWATLAATSLLFGLGHLDGYPPGIVGACLAGVFGLITGVLRVWTGGLLLPIIVHIGADATIYTILVRADAV